MNTEQKVEKLSGLFPSADKNELLELLVACDGSVEKTTTLVQEQFGEGQSQLQQEKRTDNIQTKQKQHDDTEFGMQIAREFSIRGVKRKFPGVFDEKPLLHQATLKNYSRGISSSKLPRHVGKTVTLFTKEEVEETLPDLVFEPDFLNKAMASKLLSALVSKRAAFTHNKFYIAGQKCQSKHSTAVFRDTSTETNKEFVFTDSGEKNVREFFTEMKLCAYEVEDKVNDVLSERKPKSSYQVQRGWKANLCVSNLFQQENQNLDWHSDKLSDIGPLPIIASISVGATRIFRVRRLSTATDGGQSTIFNIPLPHNTLLIMLPGIQEEFKHCVPSMDGCLLDTHPEVGKVRYSLTFRMIRNELIRGRPKCPICGSSMVLKRMFKNPDTKGYYFWLCGSQYSGYKCKGFYYGKFDKMNVPGEHLYTRKRSEATRWVSDDQS